MTGLAVQQSCGMAGGGKAPAPAAFFGQLRPDVDLYPGTPQADGSPTWVLHDPVANHFLEIGWLEFEIISRWSLGSSQAIVQSINRETALTVSEADIKRTGLFLESQQVLLDDPQTLLRKSRLAARKKYGSVLRFLVSHYLFFRVPILRPDAFLGNTLWLVRPLFGAGFRCFLGVAALLALFLVLRQWDAFIRTTLEFLSWDSLVYYAAAVFVAKCCHELGHAYCCKHYGLHVPVIGIAFLVFWPFLYTDTGESWKLTSRRQRLHIVAAGMAAEGALAVLSTLAWTILPPGVLRNTAFFLATTSWIMTLAVNISPFMRWDGYYLLSDLTGIKNLQPRSMALARWRLRELIFDFGDPPPEEVRPGVRRFMILYALGVWLYRLMIFTGIALMVYHFFIKVLGIVLGTIELLCFIWLPIQKELLLWYRKRREMHWNRHSIVSLALLTLLALLFFLPWRSYQLLPAVLRPAEFTELYPPFAARIEKVHVRPPARVHKGEPLFDLASPELDFNIRQAATEIKLAGALLQRANTDIDLLREQREVAIEQNVKAQQLYRGFREKAAMLHITAPFDGVVVAVADELRPGLWVGEGQSLGMIANTEGPALVFAYTDAEGLPALSEGAAGFFYAEHLGGERLPVSVIHISRVNTALLGEPLLASVHGGPIAVEEAGHPGQYRPKDSIFLVVFAVAEKGRPLRAIQRGHVRVASEPRSYALRMWRNLHSLLIRESGF